MKPLKREGESRLKNMKRYKCENCEEVLEIECSHDINSCPCCGCPDSLVTTDEEIGDNVSAAKDWTDKEEHDGCGAIYSVISEGCIEYCPNCGGQNG